MVYSCEIWGATDKQYINKLQVHQNKAIRCITHSKSTTNLNDMYTKAKLLKINDIYNQQLAIFFYKLKSKQLPQHFMPYLVTNSSKHNLRSNILNTYSKNSHRKKHSFIAGAVYWNRLPNNIKNKNTLKSLKKMLSNTLIQQYSATESTE